jgi:hypothetical protein
MNATVADTFDRSLELTQTARLLQQRARMLRRRGWPGIQGGSDGASRPDSGSPGRRILARRLLPPWRAAGWVITSHSNSWSVNRSPVWISIGDSSTVVVPLPFAGLACCCWGFTPFRFTQST